MLDIIKVVILSLVEGITEFIPVSSTGHLILVKEFIKLKSESFANMFSLIIQLVAILSVLLIYFNKLNPFSHKKSASKKRETIEIWKRVIIGVLPAAVLGLKFDDFIDEKLMNPYVVMTTLFVWGIVIIFIEARHKKAKIKSISDMSYKTALLIGLAQCIALVPGTSRSAATIIGAMLLGCSRTVSAEFSFFLAIPTMFGATSLKIVKVILRGTPMSMWQVFLILLGTVLSFIFALIVIRKFIKYVKEHNFIAFGLYRVVLSVVMAIYFLIIAK